MFHFHCNFMSLSSFCIFSCYSDIKFRVQATPFNCYLHTNFYSASNIYLAVDPGKLLDCLLLHVFFKSKRLSKYANISSAVEARGVGANSPEDF